MIPLPRDRTIPLTIAALSLGIALQVRDGLYSPIALTLVGITIAFAFAALLSGGGRSDAAFKVLLGAVLIQLILLLTDWPGSHHQPHTWRDYRFILIMIAVAIALVPTRWHPYLLMIYLLCGIWLLQATRSPQMDVFVFQRGACDALVSGLNPYAISYPDIYGPQGTFVYAPELVKDGRLLFGFPYMPLTLWFDTIAQFTIRDYRVANLLAMFVAGYCIILTGGTRQALLAALLLLFTPRGFFVIEQGWTEPLMVVLLAMTVLAASRIPKLLPYVFGLLLASKQYMVLLIPLVPLLTDWRDWRFHLKAIATACVVTVPIVLWDVSAFWHSAIALQFRQPFRDDALSFAALLHRLGVPKLPTIVPLIAAIAVAIWCTRRFERSPHHFALGVAVTFLTFFALNKQAFANYYFFVIAALCCATASLKPNDPIVR